MELRLAVGVGEVAGDEVAQESAGVHEGKVALENPTDSAVDAVHELESFSDLARSRVEGIAAGWSKWDL